MEAGGDEPRKVGHVAKQERAHFVGDLPELVRLDGARIRGAAAHDQLRLGLLGQAEHLVVVDGHRLARYAVAHDRVEPAAEIHLQSVRQMAAVVEAQRENRVAGLQNGHVDGHVRRRPRVGLHVRVLGAEELLRAIDRKLFDLIDDLAPAVVALAGIPLRVLVGRHGAHGLEHGGPGEVLGGDQLDLAALALELLGEEAGDVGIDVVEARGNEVVKGLLHDGHLRVSSPWGEGMVMAGAADSVQCAAAGTSREGTHHPVKLLVVVVAALVIVPAALRLGLPASAPSRTPRSGATPAPRWISRSWPASTASG